MMPGETHSAAPGAAADLARCQGCASLQQNLNEYVEALITLKQKIINTDNLLTEYQKKCDELQFARRENSTLHHQVEQMLQKISPLQKCQEELGSLKAELEEKKSSLKLYQDTHQEYARVREECLKSDAQKKKLEAKVKKLEEAAVKQTQDFKQLRNEKKILEKEFKKTQERLDEFSKQKNEKELRHIGTQISSDSYGSIDKRKVKLLLKELWLCVNTAHRAPGAGSRRVPEQPTKENTSSSTSGEEDALPPAQGGLPRVSDVHPCLPDLSMEAEGEFTSSDSVEGERPGRANHGADHVSTETRSPEVFVQRLDNGDSAGFPDRGHVYDEDLQAVLDFFKLPPPLLSPVPSPPLMSSPHLGSLPSSLAPEAYFGEYSDSSDNDSAPLRNSAESASEDEPAPPQDYFGLSKKDKGSGTWEEKPKSHEAPQALNKFGGDKMTPFGLETVRAAQREPSAACSSPQEAHCTASPESVSGRERDRLDQANRQLEVWETDECVQAEKALHKPSTSPWVEKVPGSLPREQGVAAGKSELRYSALAKRPLNELVESEGKTLSPIMAGLPQLEFTKWTLAGEIASESDCGTSSGHFQRVSREMAKGGEDTQGSTSESPEPESYRPGDTIGTAGLDVEANFSSSSTSVPVSVRSNPQSSQLEFVRDTDIPTKVAPDELHPSQSKSHTKTLHVSPLHSEPPGRFRQESDLENNLPTSSPGLGASAFRGQETREAECTEAVKSLATAYSLPQSVFRKATKDGQCESHAPVIELTLQKANLTSPSASQAGVVKSGSGFSKSTSWHHSELLRRGALENLRTTSDHEQKTSSQPEKAVPASQNPGSAAVLELPRENTSPVGVRAAASLLPNQVSVITKQARRGGAQSAHPEHWKPPTSEPRPPADSCDDRRDDTAPAAKCAGERDSPTQHVEEGAVRKSSSPEVSTSWSKLHLESPGGPAPAETCDCSTDSQLPFASKDTLVLSQGAMREAAAQGEGQKPPQSPHSTETGSLLVEHGQLPPAEAPESGGSPVEELSCADAAPAAAAGDCPGAPPSAGHPSRSTPTTPSGASPEGSGTTSATLSSSLCRKEEAAQEVSQTSPVSDSSCYTGIREAGGEDSEVEGSEALSCSEGEPEADATAGSGQPAVAGNTERELGDREARAAGSTPSADVGYLTSALQNFNISTFPDIDRLSTSEVVMFLESCQLRDYSSGDSVSECSSKGTRNKDMNKLPKQSGSPGGKCSTQPCEEETPGTSEEWIESEEDEDALKNPSQLAQCSLETLSQVLTKIGEELHTGYQDCNGKDAGDLLRLAVPDSLTNGDLKEKVPAEEAPSPASHTPEPPPPTAQAATGDGSPVNGGPHPEPVQSAPEAAPGSARQEGRAGPVEPAAPCSASAAEPRTEPSPGCEAEMAFQYQISTVTSEVINVLINKDQDLVIEKGDSWTIIHGVAVSPDADQVILCSAPGDAPASQDQEGPEATLVAVTPAAKSPETSRTDSPFPEPLCDSNLSGVPEDVSSSGHSTHFDKSRLRNRPVKPSIWISSQIYDQTYETQNVASDHTYYNSKLEPCSKQKNRSKMAAKDQSSKPGKASAPSRGDTQQGEAPQASPGERGGTKTQRGQTQPIVANADTSTPTDCSLDTLSRIRQEVGPPLPPLLAPLIATPPRTSQPLSPLVSSSSPSSPASPAGQSSPSCETLGPPLLSPGPEDPQQASPTGPSPSPSTAAPGSRILSSPLQFCAATPKHALPVPGRLPPGAPGHAAVGGPQENSVKILDTMYPELSARARTLNLLKGNIQLSRGPSADGKTAPGRVSALLGFKAIASTSTAFIKTGGGSSGDGSQDRSRDLGPQQDSSAKRTLPLTTPRSAKRLRLDSESPEPESSEAAEEARENLPGKPPQAEVVAAEEERNAIAPGSPVSRLPANPKETVESHDKAIAHALKKIAESSFDLLPVIRSHVYVGNISKKPVMRDQEKEVVFEFSTTKKHLAECLLHSILSELKIQKTSTDHNYIHALCRVYVGICRQLGDLERARLFCYSLLKEDFPDCEKLTLFIANMWHDIFLSQSVVSKAMQLVARQRAKGEVLNCLRAFLSWEKNAPVDVGIMVSKLLLTIQLCPKTEFQSSEKFGEDLSDNTWEYIFAIDLLCCHQKWIWTHDNIISKELWPVMDKWIKYRKGHANIAYTPDVIIASILRLIGRLGQLGLKEGFPTAVKNISSVIGMFIQHAQDEDIPWGIQLAAVYALCDLSPSNPAEISKILEAWRRETSNSIPSAIVSCLEEVSSLSTEGLG